MEWSDRSVLVTGGAGFIGSHLARTLVARGARVTVLDDLSTGRRERLAGVADRLRFIHASTLDLDRVRDAMRGVDTVFHLAAVLGVRRTWEEPVRVITENIQGTHHVLEAASEAGARHVVLASSSEVYGDGTPPYSEDEAPAPRTGYAAAKLVEEKLAEAYTLEKGLATTSLRFFNVYGPGQESSAYGFVTAIFCARVGAGLPPIVFGDGEQTRDLTFVEDTVEGTLRAAAPDEGHRVLNLGTGRETRIRDLALHVATAAGRADLRPVHAAPRADEVRRRVADTKRARELLGWAPRVALADGLARTVGGRFESEPAFTAERSAS